MPLLGQQLCPLMDRVAAPKIWQYPAAADI